MDLRAASTTLILLFIAAVLEAGGDAVVRIGLRTPEIFARIAAFAIGGLILFTYGYVVNGTPWDFGRLIGVYIVFFFGVAQLINWIVFHQRPSAAVLLGGAFIIAGGAIISYGS